MMEHLRTGKPPQILAERSGWDLCEHIIATDLWSFPTRTNCEKESADDTQREGH